MATYDLLTTAGINSYIDDYRASETKKQVDPLTTKKKNTDDLITAYTDLTTKLNALKTISYQMQLTDSSSAFLLKKASSSDPKFVDITATSAAVTSSQSIRVNQLAKNDLVISQDLNSTAASTTITAPGTHNMVFTAGDGKGGTFTSRVAVTFTDSDFTAGSITNANVIAKIQSAINSNKEVVLSNSFDGATASAGSFNLNLNGTVTAINYTAGNYKDVIDNVVTQVNKLNGILAENKETVLSNSVTGSTASAGSFNLNLNGIPTAISYSAGTYASVLDSIVTQINGLTQSGFQAEKIDNGGGNYSLKLTSTDPSKLLTVDGDTSGLLGELGINGATGKYGLKLTVTDSSKYLTIDGDTSALLSELGVSVNNEMGAAGLLSASTFSPDSTLSQLSIAAKKSGDGFKLLSLSDTTGNALASVGLNLGGARTTFVQNTSGTDTSGFVYGTDELNAKFDFNGIKVERNSNQISDLITGATINLKSLMQATDTTVNLDISSDSDQITQKIQDFIKNFNDIYVYLKEKTKSDKDGRGLLINDSTAESFKYLFSSIATSGVAGISTDEINTLSKLGITFSVTDGLNLDDSAKLTKAIKEKPGQVESLFNSTNGIAKTLYTKILPYVNATGYLYARKKSYGVDSVYLDDRIKTAQDRLEKSASDLRIRMMKSMSQLNALVSNQSIFFMKSLY